MKKTLPFALTLISATLVSVIEGNGGYSYADCTYVKGDYESVYFGSRCFCYTSAGIKWRDIWSTFQVSLSSAEDVFIVYPMEIRNCRDPFKNPLVLATCLYEVYWPSSAQKEKTVDIPLVDENVFFMIKSPRASAEYTLNVSRQRFNWMRFFLFVSGVTLFFFAGAVCRSSLFFYISGISLGIMSILVFLLLALKSFVPNRGLFLMLFGAGSSLTYLGIQKVMNGGDEGMRLYWREFLGYLLLSGFVSFAFCYKLGPITNKCTLNLMTWSVQVVAVVVACHGITYSPLSLLLLTTLLCFKILPLLFIILLGIWRQTCRLLSSLVLCRGRKHPRTRLLTEQEYKEQGEIHTKACLEELRKYCNNPGFPAWDTVLRLRSPQRFAEFLQSGAHVTASELQGHEQYHRDMEYDRAALLDLANSPSISEDFSEDELHSYSHRPAPNPTPIPTPPPSLVPFNSMPALAGPPAYEGQICPYPPTPFTPFTPFTPLTPQPQPAPIEDDDDPF